MHIKTPDELQAIADDLRNTADSLAVMIDQLVPDSHLMKDVFLRWPLMIHDAADKLASRPMPWDGLPVWPGEHASEDEIWDVLLRRQRYWRQQEKASGETSP